MARTRYVHRTIKGTEVEVMTVNPSTKEIGSVAISVQGTYEDVNKLDKEVRKAFDSLNLDTKYVSITDSHVVTKEYRMLESQFMTLAEAKIVDGDTPVDEDEEEDEE